MASYTMCVMLCLNPWQANLAGFAVWPTGMDSRFVTCNIKTVSYTLTHTWVTCVQNCTQVESKKYKM